MSWELLGYPQFVLLFGPVLLRCGWFVARGRLAGLRPQVRTLVLLLVIMLPLLACLVPYLPQVSLGRSIPWRAPPFWGVMNWPLGADWWAFVIAALTGWALLITPVAALLIMLVRSTIGLRRIARLPRTKVGERCYLVPGNGIALTVGLLRPKILLSADVWQGPHQAVILQHERVHARWRHPGLILLARASLALWWWLPGSRQLVHDLRAATEEWADVFAARRCGRRTVGQAVVELATTAIPGYRDWTPSTGSVSREVPHATVAQHGILHTPLASGFSECDDLDNRMRALVAPARRGLGAVGYALLVLLVIAWLTFI